ncbi:hypothetical protein [Streptomyces goshikiensis]|uniref:hypothetical protein n=1 Tax=Streptomyces goshikiensis TaxID=1942 RepID=UPI0036CE2053
MASVVEGGHQGTTAVRELRAASTRRRRAAAMSHGRVSVVAGVVAFAVPLA